MLIPFTGYSYDEAEVVRSTPVAVTVKRAVGPDKTYPLLDVIVPSQVAPVGEPSAGDVLLVRIGEGAWEAHDVVGLDGDRVVVDNSWRTRTVTRDDLMRAPASAVTAHRDRVDGRRMKHRAQQLVLHRPAGWKPRIGDEVFYHSPWDGGVWKLVTVTHIDDHVGYRVDSPRVRVDRWLSPLEIAPPPGSATPRARPGDLIVRRPEEGYWYYARVETSDDTGIGVFGALASRLRVAHGDYTVLVKRRDVALPERELKALTVRQRSILVGELLTELGVTRFDFLPHEDRTIKFSAADGTLVAEAPYRIVLSYGPGPEYTMGWAISAYQGQFPIVPRLTGSDTATVEGATTLDAFERAVAVVEVTPEELVYPASTLYVALSKLQLRIPRATALERDLSSYSRVLLDALGAK